MNNLLKIVVSLLVLFTLDGANLGNAQVSRGGIPASFKTSKSLPRANYIDVDFDVEALLRKNDEQKALWNEPPCVAKAIPVSYDMTNSGTWSTLEDGSNIWQLRIQASGALAVLFSYQKFYIPEGGKLYIYNADKSQVIGAYTSVTNPRANAFTTEMVAGDDIILEYVSPLTPKALRRTTNRADVPVIAIDNVGYVFDNVVIKHYKSDDVYTEIGESAACMININCSEGDEWQSEKDGVCQMLMYNSGTNSGAGWYVCTGTLINNTAQDLTPFVLTAFHCYDGATTNDLTYWQFNFGYEAPSCEDEEPINTHTIVGCYLRVAVPIDGGSDGLLLELADDVPAEWNVYYNGWDRRNEITEGGGVGIHHPAGDIKKISTFEDYATSTWPGDTEGAENAHWNLQFISTEHGVSVTEGGSSGSPLFNSEHLVIGTLTGGNSTCANVGGANYYGKLWYHWDQYGDDANTQMKTWLDPLNLGLTTLEGISYNPTTPRIMSDVQSIELEGTTILYEPATPTAVTIRGANLTDSIMAEVTDGTMEISSDMETWGTLTYLPDTGGVMYVRYVPIKTGHESGTIKLSNPIANDYYINLVASSCPEFVFDTQTLAQANIYQSYTANIEVSDVSTDDLVFEVVDGTLPLGIAIDETSGVIQGESQEEGSFPFTVLVTDGNGCFNTMNYTLVVNCTDVSVFPFVEGFEDGYPPCWTEDVTAGKALWTIQTGGNAGGEHPEQAYQGSSNLCFRSDNYDGNTAYYITPQFNLSGLEHPVLSFARAHEGWESDQDKLQVFYKTSKSGTWNLLAQYEDNIAAWTVEHFALPKASDDYYIGFYGEANFGYGVVLDNIVVASPVLELSPQTVYSGHFVEENIRRIAQLHISGEDLLEDITISGNEKFAFSTDKIKWDTTCVVPQIGGDFYVSCAIDAEVSSQDTIWANSTATELAIPIVEGVSAIKEELGNVSDIVVNNPFGEVLSIRLSKSYSEVTVVDALGRIVYTLEDVEDLRQLRINTSTWSQGVYSLIVRGALGHTSIKLVKQ